MIRILIVTFLSITFSACGQPTRSIDKNKEQLDKVCDSFMKLFSEGKTGDAFRILKENTVMNPASIDTLQVTSDSQINTYFTAFGKMLKADFILERKIQDIIAKRFYILGFEKYYLKFEFTLYKASNGWTITNFKYNEDIIELLY